MAKNKTNVWVEYERRKAEISRTATSVEDYQKRIAALCRELGI